MFSLYLETIRKHSKKFSIAFVAIIITAIAELAPTYIIQLFIDNMVAGELTRKIGIAFLFALFMAAVIAYIGNAILMYLVFGESFSLIHHIRIKIFKRLLGMRSSFYEQFRSGDLMTRMTEDIPTIGYVMAWFFMAVVLDGVTIITLMVLMLGFISWKLTLLSLIPLLIYGVIMYFLTSKVEKSYEIMRESVTHLNDQVLEVVEGVRVIRTTSKAAEELFHFKEKTAAVNQSNNAYIKITGLYNQAASLFSAIAMVIGMGYGAQLLQMGEVTLGMLVSFQLYLTMLNYSIWDIASIFSDIQQGRVAYRKIRELEETQDHLSKSGLLKLDHIHSIEWQNYGFKYPLQSQPSLRDIQVTLKEGETLGIVGKTGSGKTTLIRQLLRQWPVGNQGRLLINGQAIEDYDLQSLSQQFAYVPQEHFLFSQSVKENILFSNPTASDQDLDQVLQAADLAKDIDQLSRGLETLVGEKGVALSGGQKQRLAIARALIAKAPILILDDALSAVDANTERTIINHIHELRSGQTNLIVTHRLSAVQTADYIIVLDQGRIIQEGTPVELQNQSGWYADQYHLQQMGGKVNEGI